MFGPYTEESSIQYIKACKTDCHFADSFIFFFDKKNNHIFIRIDLGSVDKTQMIGGVSILVQKMALCPTGNKPSPVLMRSKFTYLIVYERCHHSQGA